MDTHFNYRGTPYDTAYQAERDTLIASGVKHVRDGSPTTNKDYIAKLSDLCAHGIKHGVGFPLDATLEKVRTTLDIFTPACVDFVEPSNEYDEQADYGTKDPDWVPNIVAEQRLLDTTIHNDPRYATITVLGPALSNIGSYRSIGNIEDAMDAGNLHFSTCDGFPSPQGYHHLGLDGARSSTPTKPIWTTETQYSDNAARRCYLPDDTIATYVPRTIAERWNAGQPRTYWYEFSDQPTDVIFGKEGFVDATGAPKPQYFALQSLLREVADPGPAFPTKSSDVAIAEAPPGLAHTLLARRDGKLQLLLWLEVPSWDTKNRSKINVAPAEATISVPGFRSARLATYRKSWTFDHANIAIKDGLVRLPVSDRVEILTISP